MFIDQDNTEFYYITDVRGFMSQELMIPKAYLDDLVEICQEYRDVQAYLARSYELTRQGAYDAAKQLEVPECLRKERADAETADQPVEASAGKQPKGKGTAAASSSTLPKAQKQQASSSSTSPQTE